MQKIKITSQMLYLFFRSLCWIVPLLLMYFVFFRLDTILNSGFISLPLVVQFKASSFSFPHRLLIFSIIAMPLSVTVFIYYALSNLFKLFERGILFEMENIRLIKQLSILMLLGQFLNLIYEPLLSAALTFNNPVGERMATLHIGSTNLASCVTAVVLLVASWIVQEAYQMKAEAQLTV